MSVRLFIGNLPYTATEAELREHLSSVGVPTSVVLPVDRETGRPRGFAFVDYADRAVAEEAIKRFDQQPFKGRGLAVSEARPREDRPPGAAASRRIQRPAARRLRRARGRPAARRLRAAPGARRRGGFHRARRRRRRRRAPRGNRRTSVPTRRPSTSASRTGTGREQGPRARSRSVRSAVSTRTTRTGAPEGRGPARHRQHRDAQGSDQPPDESADLEASDDATDDEK